MIKHSIKKIIKSSFTISLATSLFLTTTVVAEDKIYIPYDELIFNETVNAAYVGFENGDKLINNISFNDTVNHKDGEYIAKLGALDIIKGSGYNYRPNENITNMEALIGVLRMNGLEKEALDLVGNLSVTNPTFDNYELMQLAFAEVAVQYGYLTNQELTDVRIQDTGDTTLAFDKNANVTRERLAFWIGHLITIINPDVLDQQTVQSINKYTDYKVINPLYLDEVEDVTSLGIMDFPTSEFLPNANVTRGDYAHYLSNIDQIYLDYIGYEKKQGFVGGIKTHNEKNPSTNIAIKDFYIRDTYGNVDIIRNYTNDDNVVQTFNLNTPVYKNGVVTNILSLEEGDTLEYIVDPITSKVYFISAKEKAETFTQGRLYNIDYVNQNITLRKDRIATETYPLSSSVIIDDNVVMKINGFHKKIHKSELPFGSIIGLELKNNVVTELTFIGDVVVENEIHGIVVENNSDFGYLTIINRNRQRKTYNYYNNDIIVEKQGHYGDDNVGYYDEMFQSTLYDGRDTVISNIEAGDVVFFKTFEDDPEAIESISASTNYIMRYGKTVSFVNNGDYSSLVVQYENGVTDQFNISNNIIMMKDGKLINAYEVRNGDYIKFLVNYAVISPGVYMETIKELFVEGDARHISTIYKGSFGGVDLASQKFHLKNAKDLTATSWANYSQLENLSIKNNVDIFYNNKQVDINFLNNYLKYSDAVTYVALEKSYSGDIVKKVSIYDGRDMLLEKDFISNVLGNDIYLSDTVNGYEVQNGSIVIRDGRLVDINSVLPMDYAHISTNKNVAVVVNITQPINNEMLTLQRGRVYSVDEGNSFKVSSIATYDNSNWNFTPVQKEYLIDYDTLFINENGEVRPIEELLDYTVNTSFEIPYNIISDGTKAIVIATQPYVKEEIKGIVYNIENGNVHLKDATYKDNDTNTWKTVSYENNYVTVTPHPNNLIIKNSEFVNGYNINVGDTIRILTDDIDAPVEAGDVIFSYITYVEE